MHPAAEARKVILRVLALAVGREAIPGCGGRGAAPGPLVATIGPKARSLGPSCAGGEHPDRCVVHDDGFAGSHVPADGLGQRLEERGERGGLAHPVGQRGAIEVEAIALEDLALPVERKVVGILAHQHMGEQPGAGTSPLDGARGERRLGEALAARAGQPRPHDPVHDEAAGHILELLGHVLADPAKPAATAEAAVTAGRKLDLLARDVVRDRAALGPVLLF